jgi:hypothetical protein
MTMELIDRYVQEVGRHLPPENRDDVQAELRSLLLDSLEQRAAESGRTADEETAVALLREFGHPQEVADRYRPEPRYLIGPRFYPAFRAVASVIVIGFAILYSVGAVLMPVLASAERHLPGWRESGMLFWGYLQAVSWNLTVLAVIFMIVERRTAAKPHVPREWDPRKLPARMDAKRVSVFRHVFEIYWIALFLTLLDFFPQWFGVMMNQSEAGFSVIPLRDLGIHVPVLMANLCGVMAILFHVRLLQQGRWQPAERWAELGLAIFWIGILASIWMNLTPVNLASVPERVSSLLSRTVAVMVPGAMVVSVIRVVVLLSRMFMQYVLPTGRNSGSAETAAH